MVELKKDDKLHKKVKFSSPRWPYVGFEQGRGQSITKAGWWLRQGGDKLGQASDRDSPSLPYLDPYARI